MTPLSEADTCRTYITPQLHAAGWEDDFISEQLVLTPGRIIPLGEKKHYRQRGLRADCVLFSRKNIPIAMVEAKPENKPPGEGLQQAVQYAEILGVKFTYSSTGHAIIEHDFITGQKETLTSYPSPDELWARQRGVWGLEKEADALNLLPQVAHNAPLVSRRKYEKCQPVFRLVAQQDTQSS